MKRNATGRHFEDTNLVICCLRIYRIEIPLLALVMEWKRLVAIQALVWLGMDSSCEVFTQMKAKVKAKTTNKQNLMR